MLPRSAREHAGRLCIRSRALCATYATHQPPRERRVYLIAGEASGDAIGAKLIAALQRKATTTDRLVIRGIGGNQMMQRGGFSSLFPMEELSVMGLVEVLPSLWRLRQRLADTITDIRAFKPDVVLTIDSKGFTFRVHRALADDATLSHSIKRMHYVAPSVWAYKHRQRKTDYGDLARLLHKMFVILPFEPAIFNGGNGDENWCQFVGHPAVEDFLEAHHMYERENIESMAAEVESDAVAAPKMELSDGALLKRVELDVDALRRRGVVFEQLMTGGNNRPDQRVSYRTTRSLPADAFIVCALVGSRENEVNKTLKTVLEALDAVMRPAERIVKTSLGIPMKLSPLSSGCVVRRPIHVILPTIQAVEPLVRRVVDDFCASTGASRDQFIVQSDMSAQDRLQLFQSADAAVAVSGTIVMETALAALPTVVIYRANRITEVLAKQLSAVDFVSIPNLLLGRAEIPELLFSDCTVDKISDAVRQVYQGKQRKGDGAQLAQALSTLTPWASTAETSIGVPVRGSDLVAESLWRAMDR